MVLSNGLTSPPPLEFIVQSTQTHLAFSQQIIRNIFEKFFFSTKVPRNNFLLESQGKKFCGEIYHIKPNPSQTQQYASKQRCQLKICA